MHRLGREREQKMSFIWSPLAASTYALIIEDREGPAKPHGRSDIIWSRNTSARTG
jgi:hypothetical protein